MTIKEMRSTIDALATAHAAARENSNNPHETARGFIRAVGPEEAVEGGYFHQDDLEAPRILEKGLLSGAASWGSYSWGGCSLCYDADIAERLCTPSELKRKRGGDLRPNRSEEWLDVQARALFQACRRILWAARVLRHEALKREGAAK